ncbi:putative Tubulin-specific chaperone [Taphrina deformans PYCC 5710]|uniref:Tubulin-specific chaperone n=1 Tax=Taphrina deformans (strain PYCC 5710 / ATCC 11124 / CBS 356.35 / IMI 108563 / JCM 9778 / NBRC 8474) TaxID=1097556 RepID=R4XBT5_TAPDE|nr:putative Tubulin-specific chaperone [Taphrina deformans PYCC 5710]|eukprot:CCG83259.1 putative Tubulin-specific chaperone [Taphrina deformans PYCC 5710]
MYVGQRISLDGHRGTIRYLGSLEDSPSSWTGVEWDDSSRGKHSGTFKGQQIFACKQGSGSFLKSSKVSFDKSYSITEAISYKYIEDSRGVDEEVSNVVGISRPVQSVGFDKIRERFRDLSQITELYLADESIEFLDLDIDRDFSKVTTLDLSWNLISSFNKVLELSQRLPLRTLKLEKIQILIKHHFAKLTVLHLAHNDLLDCQNDFELVSITSLDLLGNKISDLHLLVSHFPALEILNVSNNDIKFIRPAISSSVQPGARLKHINLAGNPLEDLQDVSNLAVYPNLCSLQFTLLFDDKKDENSRLQLIKYLPQLQVINRTKVTLQERQDADRFGQTPVNLTRSMVNNFVTLKLVSETGTLDKKLLKTQTVKQLKATFARFVKLRPTQIRTLAYHYKEQTIELHDDLAQLSYYDLSDGGSVLHSE